MIDRFGQDRFIIESKAEKIHEDSFGILYKKELKDDPVPLVVVKVINSTAEPDGTFKDYWLRVDPELRPMLENNQFGNPQKLTARNAIASTFGVTGNQYILKVQS
jgi:hypothetical protein